MISTDHSDKEDVNFDKEIEKFGDDGGNNVKKGIKIDVEVQAGHPPAEMTDKGAQAGQKLVN